MPAANQANVLVRWIQTADSNAGYDHWGLDNIEIQVTQPGSFSWNVSPIQIVQLLIFLFHRDQLP